MPKLRDGGQDLYSRAGTEISLVSAASIGAMMATVLHTMRGALSPGVKKTGREADHSLQASVEVKKQCSHTPLRHTSLQRGP
jgi:hypothetical protein